MAAPALETLERLASEHADLGLAPSKRMLVIVNPYATTVSDRLRNLVVYALRGRYEVDAIDTTGRNHATELCREAASEGYDVVVAFGGDGTVNEAANGLAGSETPLTCLPGGATNVYARILGIPHEIVDATEHLLRMADDFKPRRVDLARVNERHFTFSSGIGLDASVVRRVDEHPKLKRRLGEFYFTQAAVTTFTTQYIFRPPQLEISGPGIAEPLTGVTTIVQNARPFTYFGEREIEMSHDAAIDDGHVSAVVLHRANPLDIPTVLFRAFARRAKVPNHGQVTAIGPTREITVRSLDDRAIPLQVDGDHIGEVTEAVYGVTPRGLAVVS